MALSGWSKVPGSSRYTNPQGQEVSRRQYDNARAQAEGFKSYNQYAKLTHYGRTAYPARQERGQDYHRWSNQWAKAHGVKPSEARKLGSEFNKLYAATFINRKGEFKSYNRMRKTATGPLAKFLSKAGYRPEGASYAVGRSPGIVEIPAAA
jgi:hypothetical protein